jgi:hypothetical protein
MRFKQYLQESAPLNLEQFKKDCAYYFSLKGDRYLHHAAQHVPDHAIIPFRERTGPRDSPTDLHDRANEFFKKEFGFPFRNGLFTSGSANNALLYGDQLGVVFPIGKFEWLCSPDFHDLTGNMEMHRDVVRNRDGEQDYDVATEKAITLVMQDMNNAAWFHNDHFQECLKSNSEIMIKCEKFYIFNKNESTFMDQVEPFIKSLK